MVAEFWVAVRDRVAPFQPVSKCGPGAAVSGRPRDVTGDPIKTRAGSGSPPNFKGSAVMERFCGSHVLARWHQTARRHVLTAGAARRT
jgi:hypothetical protein